MSKPIVYSTVDEYLAGWPEPVRRHLETLRSLILAVAPEAGQLFNYNIPAFSLITGGKRDQQIMMAGYASHVGLYPGPDTIEHFEPELGPYKHAKGSVQFPVDRQIPEELVRRMVQWKLERVHAASSRKI